MVVVDWYEWIEKGVVKNLKGWFGYRWKEMDQSLQTHWEFRGLSY